MFIEKSSPRKRERDHETKGQKRSGKENKAQSEKAIYVRHRGMAEAGGNYECQTYPGAPLKVTRPSSAP